MRNFKGQKGTFLIIATGLICLSRFAYANGEETWTASSESSSASTADVGTGTFSRFPFHVSVSVRGGYDDNVSTSKFNREESWFTNAGILLTYDFGSPRTKLSLQTGTGFTYYWDRSNNVGFNDDEYDVNAFLGFSLSHKASARLTLTATSYSAYQTEPDFSVSLGIVRRSGSYFYTQNKATVTYLWLPRFATATSYTLGAVQYEDNAVGFFEDRFENTFGNEFRFLLSPTTALVGEYRYQIVSYEHDTGRDSMTHFVLGGFDHAFSTRLKVSFRGGAEFREYETNRQRSSPYFEGTVDYEVGKNTTVSWTSRYSIEEGDVLLNPGRTTFRTGLRAKHDFTPRISGSVAAFYQQDDYHSINSLTAVSPSFDEGAFDVALTLRYALTRYFGIEAGYSHTEVWSDILVREYTRNRFWGGLNVSF